MRLIQEKLTNRIWEYFKELYWQQSLIPGGYEIILDHFAIIDIPSANSGIKILEKIFTRLSYVKRGEGYLETKRNGFIWMGTDNMLEEKMTTALPQLVLADFSLENLSRPLQEIVNKYGSKVEPFPFSYFNYLLTGAKNGDADSIEKVVELLFNYLINRTWPRPTLAEYEIVNKENELLSWVLACGRTINHFGICVNNITQFNSFTEYTKYLLENNINLNEYGGTIKGSRELGLEQAATIGRNMSIQLSDATIQLPSPFIEFIWRHPLKDYPKLLVDYYTNFLPSNANNIIESVYES
jgi:hypothetical protein